MDSPGGGSAVPEGPLTVAREFIPGDESFGRKPSPIGTTDGCASELSRPSGTEADPSHGIPAMNCWAILTCPSGTDDPVSPADAVHCDLVERDQVPLPLTGGQVPLKLAPEGMAAVRLR